jgi:hypothetical protein
MMALKTLQGRAMVVCFCFALGAGAKSGDRPANIKDNVLDILFQPDAQESLHISKMTLRFGDTDTQLVVLVYPRFPAHLGGQAEIVSYSIAGVGNAGLSPLIDKMVAQDPNVTAREIADKLKVSITHVPLDIAVLRKSMRRLRTIRLSPLIVLRSASDDYSQYNYWYDSGQESVHFSFVGPFRGDAQDRLVQWMIGFKNSFADLCKADSAPKPSTRVSTTP